MNGSYCNFDHSCSLSLFAVVTVCVVNLICPACSCDLVPATPADECWFHSSCISQAPIHSEGAIHQQNRRPSAHMLQMHSSMLPQGVVLILCVCKCQAISPSLSGPSQRSLQNSVMYFGDAVCSLVNKADTACSLPPRLPANGGESSNITRLSFNNRLSSNNGSCI